MVNRMTIDLRADSSQEGITIRDANIVDWTVQKTINFRPARSLTPWETIATDEGIYSTVGVDTPSFSLSSPDQTSPTNHDQDALWQVRGEMIELQSVSERLVNSLILILSKF